MQGIDILNRTEIIETPYKVKIIIIFAAFVTMLSILGMCVAGYKLMDLLMLVSITTFVISVAAMISTLILYPKIPTGRYRYECTIDESVTLQDIYNNYKVIEQRGKIWILEDKE